MKLRFRQKVFLAFLSNGLLIAVSMLLIAAYYGHRNFEEYLAKVEGEKLQELAETLGREYRKNGNWESVLNSWNKWGKLAAIGPPDVRGSAGDPPPPPPPLPISPPPAPSSSPPAKDPGEEMAGVPPGRVPGRGRMPAQHLVLFDRQKQPLTGIGASVGEYQFQPVIVDGLEVAWLGLKKDNRPMHPLDAEFLRHQLRTLYTIGGVALLLAVLVTIFLSRHLLASVREFAEGARAWTSRRFDTRIEVRGRDEFGQLAADFNAMAQELERHEQMRRQWIADISHELRTPLAVLRGEIEAMQDGVRKINAGALDSLHFEVLHVNRIVHDLHDLSLIESEWFRFERTPVSPLEVLDEAIKSFQPLFEQRGIRIEAKWSVAAHATIMADADRLKQLFSNILNNTLRYTQVPGVLEIRHEIAPDRLVLHFDDSGPGVPEESLDRLFDRLYRVDRARSRSLGGSGLGLAICKSIVECFGGRITASKSPRGGLRITVIFPISAA